MPKLLMQPEEHRFLAGRYPEEKKDSPKNSDGFLIYKLSLAILCSSMMAYGWWDQKTNPKDVHGSHSYTDYVSNWNDISCTAWSIMNAIVAFQPAMPAAAYGLLSGMNAIAPTFSCGVAFAFWTLLPADRQSTDLVSLHQHAFLAIITVVDLFLVAAPIRYFHIISTWIFAGCYAINTMIVYFLFDRDDVYPFLNYSDKFSNAVKFDLAMTFGLQTIMFSLMYLFSKTKFWVHRKITTVPEVDSPGESKTELLEKGDGRATPKKQLRLRKVRKAD
ncbi:Oidioi.mRNA.OKI2018_I69.chr1.g2808.t1.cds [Oikopleura dioica]|uniref:Oidioi.mRNA.OKI2018_I69.chr1.g2808.t1.cds n=1 Tax=Oikopleura dioica TaxID=34765 RepID=A0ABN7SXH9_OIKDI|nr:Oidioi.mRNA.OKI2018_I69.chr1.g2808.t1.cds [Oikopleura dioica]